MSHYRRVNPMMLFLGDLRVHITTNNIPFLRRFGNGIVTKING
jgi:hypothetical protein